MLFSHSVKGDPSIIPTDELSMIFQPRGPALLECLGAFHAPREAGLHLSRGAQPGWNPGYFSGKIIGTPREI